MDGFGNGGVERCMGIGLWMGQGREMDFGKRGVWEWGCGWVLRMGDGFRDGG